MKLHDTISISLLLAFIADEVTGYQMETWVYMWTLATLMLANFKWLTWIHHPVGNSSTKNAPTYLLGWIGMDPTPFRSKASQCINKKNEILRGGTLNFLVGVLLLHASGHIPNQYWLLQGWVACAGIIFVLHFGLLKINAWVLRCRGFDVEPIMKFPAATRKISEFWGGRWNKAFNQLDYPFVYTPLKRKLGPSYGLFITFLLSGLIHEIVISLPAKAGWGLPTLYFLIQALGMLAERTKIYRKLNQTAKQVFTYGIIAGPAFILFHPPFMKTVILPFVQTLGVGV